MKFRLGYGTMIALLITAVLLGLQFYQKQRAMARGPVIERQIIGSTQGIAPVPEFALRHRKELRLTDAQAQQITTIATAYRREVKPVQTRLDAAARDYEKYMERATIQPRPRTQEVTGRSREVQRLSGVLSATRHAYWQRVLAVMTPAQRQQAQRLTGRVSFTDLQ